MRTQLAVVVSIVVAVCAGLAGAQSDRPTALQGRPSYFDDASGWARTGWDKARDAGVVRGYGGGKYFPREYSTREEAQVLAHREAGMAFREGKSYTDTQILAVVEAICKGIEAAYKAKTGEDLVIDRAPILAEVTAAQNGQAAPSTPPTPAPPAATPPAQPQPAPGAGAPPSGGGATPQPAPMPQPPAPPAPTPAPPAGTPPAAGTPGAGAAPAGTPTTPPTGASMVGGLGIPPSWSPLATCGVAAFIALCAGGLIWLQRRRPRIPRPI